MVALEQNHNPVQLEADEQRLELQQEVERLRSAQVQTERTLEARERAHRQRVSGLEEQVQGPPLGEDGAGMEVWGGGRGLLMSFITWKGPSRSVLVPAWVGWYCLVSVAPGLGLTLCLKPSDPLPT